MSFRLKMIIGVALIEAMFLVLLVWQATSYLQSSGEEALTLRAQQTAQLFATTTKNAVIASDLATLDEVTEEIAAMAGVEYIRVMDAFGLMASAGTPAEAAIGPGDTSIADVDDGRFDVVLPIEEGGTRLGLVQVGLDVTSLTRVMQDARHRLLVIAGAELLMVALISWWFGHYLSRGLGALQQAASAVARGNWQQRVRVRGNDEMATTANAFNLMVDRLGQEQRRLDESHRAQLALSERSANQARYLTTVMDTMADGILTLDAHGRIAHVNAAGEGLFGYHEGALLGRDVACCFDALPAPITEWVESGRLAGRETLEAAGRPREGAPLSLKVSLAAITFEGERKLVMLVRDYTDRERLEAEVRRNLEIKAMVTDASLDALVIADGQGRIVEYSVMAEKTFGWTREEVLGHRLDEFIVPPEIREAHRRGMERFAAEGNGPLIGQRVEVEALRKGGERFPVELSLVAANLNGERMATASLRDISARKLAEKELIEARDAAEQASLAKSRFLSHMSHEIRSPLNAVLGAVGLVAERIESPEHQRLLKTAKSSGAALLAVINEVLDFSKIEAGHLVVEKEPVALESLVEDVMNAAQARLAHPEVELLALVRWRATGQVLTDPVRLRQILNILVDNAIKFTTEGVIAIDVQRGTPGNDVEQDGAELLEIRVSDTGVGIPDDQQASIFKEFEQVDPIRDSRNGGTGLGLTIARRLVALLGGEISVESVTGEGSCFCILLPVTYLKAPPRQPPIPAGPVVIASPHAALRDAMLARTEAWGAKGRAFESLEQLHRCHMNHDFKDHTRVLIDERCLWHRPDEAVWLAEMSLPLALMVSDVTRLPSAACRLTCIDKPLCASQLRAFLATSASIDSRRYAKPPRELNGTSQGRLLLVEDVEANRIVTSTLLRSRGYEVDEAVDGLDALEQAAGKSFDVILMDMRMPRLNGIDAVIRLRQGAGPNAETPVIALTANAQKGEMARCQEVGMNDFVSKPFDKERLLAVIRQHLPAPSAVADDDMSTAEGSEVPVSDQRDDGAAWGKAVCLKVAVLDQLSEDISPESLVPMLDMFLDELDTRREAIATMVSSAASIDEILAELREQAHALKSCCGTFGARRLQAIAQALEAAVMTPDEAAARALAGTLLGEIAPTREAFAAYRAEASR
ncbi:PAS domain S-box protein [Halomonas icarae]|uniref:histidine kinase n=1 Tax=Halomonas icarae TaxID=2691040 RepID=A0A7X5AJK7_9GAMM|nr:PAS domain S-box protein [Halomonas icarae]MDR5901111.1 PAS domain S-box protein [Halomonas icarae]NAW11387.1 PAS domain S-box protein [Halomonas icarae]